MRFVDRLRGLLNVPETPKRIAMAFAVGLFIGITPFFGVHILMGLAVAWMFKLNRAIMITAILVTNPWTVIPIYSFCMWVGLFILDRKMDVPELDWSLFTVSNMIDGLGQMFLPMLIGTFLVGAVVSVMSYFIVQAAVVRYRSGSCEDAR